MWCRIWIATVTALVAASAIHADVVPLDWESAELGARNGGAPVNLMVCCASPGYPPVSLTEESWDVGPFALAGPTASVSGTSWFEIDGNRWSYGIDDLLSLGESGLTVPTWSVAVNFRAQLRVPPGDDVQFIAFADSEAEEPPYDTESGLTDIRIFVAGDVVTLHRQILLWGMVGEGAGEPVSGSVELFWLTPEPSDAGGAAMALATLAAVRLRRRPSRRIVASDGGVCRCA